MRSTFPGGQPRIPVTLTRDDGSSVTLTCHALPPGYRAAVQVEYPVPVVFANGAPGGPDLAASPLYWSRVSMILLAKSLEPSGELETRRATFPLTADGWAKYADAVTAEFVAAGFSEQEVRELQDTVAEVGKATRGTETPGKSATPSGG